MKTLREVQIVTRRAVLGLATLAAFAAAAPANADVGPLADPINRRGFPRARPSDVTDRDNGLDPRGNGRGGRERQLIGVTDTDAGVDPAGSGRGAPRGRASGMTDKDNELDRPGNGRGYYRPRNPITD